MNPDFVSAPRFVRLALVTLLSIAAACGDDGSTDPSTPRAVAAVSPDSQTAPAGVKLEQPLVVAVTGGGGAPISGAVVEWTVGTGGGSVSDSITTTDAEGHAQTTYTPGTAPATATVTATAGSINRVFRIVLVAGPPSELRKFGSDSPAAVKGSILTLSVKLVDKFGNAISGKTVNWSAAGGSISATTSTTDTGGVASVTYTLGADPGTYALTATTDGVPATTYTVKAI